jgi:hypothetical protein
MYARPTGRVAIPGRVTVGRVTVIGDPVWSGSGWRFRAGAAAHRPPERPAHDIDDLVDVAIGLTALGRSPNAALDVILEDEDGQRIDGCPEGARLLEDVHAVLLALDHPAYPADLALDPREAAHELRLVAGIAVPEVVGGVVGCGLRRHHPP